MKIDKEIDRTISEVNLHKGRMQKAQERLNSLRAIRWMEQNGVEPGSVLERRGKRAVLIEVDHRDTYFPDLKLRNILKSGALGAEVVRGAWGWKATGEVRDVE